MKKGTVILLISIMVVSSVMVYVRYGWPWVYVSKKQALDVYLETKYDDDFEIETMTFDWMHDRSYHAYAVDESQVRFYVGEHPETKKFEDSYIEEKEQLRVRELLNPLINELFPDRVNHAVERLADSSIEVGIAMDEVTVTKEEYAEELGQVVKLLNFIDQKHLSVSQFSISYQNKRISIDKAEINNIHSIADLEPFVLNYNENK